MSFSQPLVEGQILVLVHRAVDVVLALALVPARREPRGIHVDRVAVDDRRERIEEGERLAAGFGSDSCGKRCGGERAGGDDRRAVGQCVDPFAYQRDVRMPVDRLGHAVREIVAVDGECGAGRDTVDIGLPHDQRAERAQFLVEQPDRVAFCVVRAEAVRTDEFGEAVGLMRGRAFAAAAHFGEAHLEARFGELPGGFGTGEAAADDVNIVGHSGQIARDACPVSGCRASGAIPLRLYDPSHEDLHDRL